MSDDQSSNVCEVIQPKKVQKPQAQSQQPPQKFNEKARPVTGVNSSATSLNSTAASSHNPNFTQSQNQKTISVESSVSQNHINNTVVQQAPESFIPDFQPKHIVQQIQQKRFQAKPIPQKSILEEVKTEDPYQNENTCKKGQSEKAKNFGNIIEVNSHSENTINVQTKNGPVNFVAGEQILELEIAKLPVKKRVQFASQNESVGGTQSQGSQTQTLTTSQTSCQTPQKDQRNQSHQGQPNLQPPPQQLPKKKSFSEYKASFLNQNDGMTYNQLEKRKEQEELKKQKNQPKIPQPPQPTQPNTNTRNESNITFVTQRPSAASSQGKRGGGGKAIDQVHSGIDQALQNRRNDQQSGKYQNDIAQQEQEWFQDQAHQQKIKESVFAQNQKHSETNIRRNNSISADFGRIENDRDSGGDGLEIVNAPLGDFQTISGKSNFNQEYPKPPPSKKQKLEIEQDCQQNDLQNNQYENYLKSQQNQTQPNNSKYFEGGSQPKTQFDYHQREQEMYRQQEAHQNYHQQQTTDQNSRYGGRDPQEYGDYSRQPEYNQNQGISFQNNQQNNQLADRSKQSDQYDEKKIKNEKWLESFKSAPGTLDLKSSYDRNQIQQSTRPQNIDIRQSNSNFNERNQRKSCLNKFFDSCKMDQNNSNQILSNRNILDGGGIIKSNHGSPEKDSTANSSARKITLKARDDTPSQGAGKWKDPAIKRWFMAGGRLIPVRNDGRTSSSQNSPAQMPKVKFK